MPPTPSAPVAQSRPAADEGILFIGPSEPRPLDPLFPARPTKRPLSVWRIFMLLGFVVSFLGLAEAFLAQATVRAAIFGFGTLIFVGMMTYPTKSGRE
ncbi:MAG: hypothetical protein P4L84_23790 [Isosphaeraceae bacterium]|nr:hypothetical protein [Isosphaeraceae bacterium]